MHRIAQTSRGPAIPEDMFTTVPLNGFRTLIAGGTATVTLFGIFHFIGLLFLTDHLNDALSRQETAAALTAFSLWLGPTMGIALFIIRCVPAATNIRRS